MPGEVQKHVLAEQDYILGMKYREIAEKYKVSLDTVKSWKKRHRWVREKGAPKTKKVCTQNKGAGAERKEAIAEAVESVIDNPDLTDKHRLFCLVYVDRFNATKAYQKAFGCDYYTAKAQGYKLLQNIAIKAEIDKLKQAKFNRAMLKPEDVFQKWMDIAFADITDYVEFGSEKITLEDKRGEEYEAVFNTVAIKDSESVDGTLISEVSQGRDGVKVKLPSREKALAWLSDHMDLATEEQRARIEHMKAQTAKLHEGDNTGSEGVMIVDDIPGESKAD